jgi:hypothetical protein
MHAAGILHAWRENNLEQLNRELARAARLDPPMDAAEYERAELLGSIAMEMQDMVASGRTDGAGVYFTLLRHLATTS